MRARLQALGAAGVPARTFHSAALAQLHALAGERPGRLLPSKALLLRQIGNALPGAYRFRPAGDLATEVEWAKNRRITPERYLAAGQHEPPLPSDLMLRVFREYERRKRGGARRLRRSARARDPDVRGGRVGARALRERYRAFTVDEYQDVNLLQQSLLDLWLGPSEEICASSATTTSRSTASPARRPSSCSAWRRASRTRPSSSSRRTTARRPRSCRSRTGSFRGWAVRRRRCARRGRGAEPVVRAFGSPETRAFVVERVRELRAEGVPYEEMAVLYRVNSRSEDFEELLGDAGIPFQGAERSWRARLPGRCCGRSAERGLRPACRGSGGSPAAGLAEPGRTASASRS